MYHFGFSFSVIGVSHPPNKWLFDSVLHITAEAEVQQKARSHEVWNCNHPGRTEDVLDTRASPFRSQTTEEDPGEQEKDDALVLAGEGTCLQKEVSHSSDNLHYRLSGDKGPMTGKRNLDQGHSVMPTIGPLFKPKPHGQTLNMDVRGLPLEFFLCSSTHHDHVEHVSFSSSSHSVFL